MIIFTSDYVFFYVHRSLLLCQSSNSFGYLIHLSEDSPGPLSPQIDQYDLQKVHGLPEGVAPLPSITVSEVSAVVNVMLHIIYGMSCQRFGPDLPTIGEAFVSLDKYGIPAPSDSSDVWSLVLHYAQAHPIPAFALAAGRNIDWLCVKISPYTLSVLLDTVTEADALTMGPVYLRRLFLLHLGRRDALKRVIERPPATHHPTPGCTMDDQTDVVRSWDTVVADLVLRPMPHNTQVEELRDGFVAVAQRRTCGLCVSNIRFRVIEAIRDWQAIKYTI